MSIRHLNLVRHVVSGTPGTGNITLGAAVSGFLSMTQAGAVNGNTYVFAAESNFVSGVATKRDIFTAAWASGTGVLSGRSTINSTNGNAIESLASDAEIVVLPAASDILAEATAAQVRAAATGSVAVTAALIESASADVALTDAATVAVDWDAGINFTLTLTTSRILGNPTNGQPGTWRNVLITQPAGGTAVLTFGNQYVFPGAIVPVIATGNAAKSRLLIYCRTSSIFEGYMYGGLA